MFYVSVTTHGSKVLVIVFPYILNLNVLVTQTITFIAIMSVKITLNKNVYRSTIVQNSRLFHCNVIYVLFYLQYLY